jgi:hypothetical protein
VSALASQFVSRDFNSLARGVLKRIIAPEEACFDGFATSSVASGFSRCDNGVVLSVLATRLFSIADRLAGG